MNRIKDFFSEFEYRVIHEAHRCPFSKMLEDGSIESYSYHDINKKIEFYSKILKNHSGKYCAVYHTVNVDLLGFILAAFRNNVKIVIRRTSLQDETELRHDLSEVMMTIPLDSAFITPGFVLPDGKEEITGFWRLLNPCSYANPHSEDTEFDFIQFSSGSTGYPRAFCLTLEGLIASADYIRQYHTVRKESVVFSYLTLSHIYGFCTGFVLPIIADAQCVLAETSIIRNNPLALFEVIERYKVTHSAVIMATLKAALQLQSIQSKRYDLSSIYCLSLGGEKINPEMLLSVEREMALYGVRKHALVNSYGMSEKGAVAMENPDYGNSDCCYKGNSYLAVGPVDKFDVEIGIFDEDFKKLQENIEGFVGIASPYLAHVYFEERTLLPVPLLIHRGIGYYLNGDLGFCHEGKAFITGRLARTIVFNGLKVSGEKLDTFAEALLRKLGCKLKRCYFFNLPKQINEIVCLIDTNQSISIKTKTALQTAVYKEFHVIISDIFIASYDNENGIGKLSLPKIISAYLDSKKQ